MKTKPNILIITSDQQRHDSLSFLNYPGYNTPNLDYLAKKGILFDHAYCPSPVCTPARISMISGLFPTRHGGYQIGMSPVPALQGPTIGSLFSQAGYSTACIGKTHFVARALEEEHISGEKNPPEDFWDNFDGPYLGFDFLRHNSGHTCNRPPDAHYRSWLNKQGKNLDHLHWQPGEKKAEGKGIDCGAWELKAEDSSSAWISGEFINWAEKQINQHKNWMAMVHFQDPHAPYVCPEPWFSQVDMSEVTLPSQKQGEFQNKPPYYQSFQDEFEYRDKKGNNLADDLRIASVFKDKFASDKHKAHQAYRGMVNMMDHYIGKILDFLKSKNQLDNTLIIFTSDHGDYLGHHGLWEKGAMAYEDCQRVPGIIHWPAAQKCKSGKHNAYFNLVDILPTCLEAAEIEAPIGIQGKSQLPLLRGETKSVCDYALVDFYASSKLHQQSLIHDGYKLVLYHGYDWGELYHLEQDPDQYDNLFNKTEYHSVRETMFKKMIQVQMDLIGKQGKRSHYA